MQIKYAHVRIESGPNAPHTAFGSKVFFVTENGDVEIPMGLVKSIKVSMELDDIVSADIVLFPGALKIEALAQIQFCDEPKSEKEKSNAS